MLAVGVIGGLLLKAIMHGAGYRIHPLDLRFAADDKLFPNARLGVESIAYLGNGDFWGQPQRRGAFALLCCALVLAAAWAVIRMARGWALERAVDDPARVVLITFWGGARSGPRPCSC